MPKKGEHKYSDEYLAEVAARYTVLKDFREKEFAAYDHIVRRGLLQKLCGHMERRKITTDDELLKIASNYDTVKEFRRKDKNAYNQICKRGLLGEFCKHMVRYEYIHSEEELEDIASRYDTVKEFRNKENKVYNQIRERGLLDRLCSCMKRGQPKPLSDDDLAAIARKYDDHALFKAEQKHAYRAMQRRGLHDELCAHMVRWRKDDYTDESLRDIALKYETRAEFQEKDRGAYGAAVRRGILKNICKHMKKLRAENGYYTKENCHVIALEYKTRADFQKGNRRFYSAARRRGWLDDICGHMVPASVAKKRKVYVFTFDDGYAYVGLTDDISRRKQEHLQKQHRKKISPVLKHYQETGAKFEFKELTDWIDMDIAGKVEDSYITRYASEGWKMLNSRRGGGLGGKGGLFLPSRMRKIVDEYEYAEDFKENVPVIYTYLCEHHMYSKYCSELKHRQRKPGYWTIEKAIKVIPECETRTILQKRYYQAYKLVKEAGLLGSYYPPATIGPYKWTIKKSSKVASLCNTRVELHKKYPGAYNALWKAGLLDKFMSSHQHCEKYDDDEKMRIIARCKNKRELHDHFRPVYEWLRLSGRLDEFYPKRGSRN